jgi:hypothetical protein
MIFPCTFGIFEGCSLKKYEAKRNGRLGGWIFIVGVFLSFFVDYDRVTLSRYGYQMPMIIQRDGHLTKHLLS